MPALELQDYDLKILDLANEKGVLYRGLFGWPGGSVIAPLHIKHMVDYGYLEFVYDWGKDRPALRITCLGRTRLLEERDRFTTVLSGPKETARPAAPRDQHSHGYR